MNIDFKKTFAPSWIAFNTAFAALLIFPIMAPSWRLFFFVPYLVQMLYQSKLMGMLWRAMWVGLLCDLFSSTSIFGITSLNYVLVAALLYSQRRHFFADKLATIPALTFFFSLVSSILGLVLAAFFGNGFPLSLRWLTTDALAMSLFDAVYALCLFTLPFHLYKKVTKLIVYAHLRKRHRRSHS